MPRPKTKDELIALAEQNFNNLNDFIASLNQEEKLKDFPEGTLNRNIKDVLFHLHHWHLMLFEWYSIGKTGKKPAMPAPGYTWKTIQALNKKIQKEYSSNSLEEAQSKFNDSHEELMRMIKSHSEQELFEKKKYKWTGSTSMGAYFISASSSHYDWAIKLIKRVKK